MRKIVLLLVLSLIVFTASSQISIIGDGHGATLYCINDTCKSNQISYNRRLIGVKIPGDSSQKFSFEITSGYVFGYADSTGKTVIRPQYQKARLFYEGYAAVQLTDEAAGKDLNREMFHIKPDGTPLYKKRFSQVCDFSNGYAWVEEYGKYDFYHIDTTGKRIYPQHYLYAYSFTAKGFALVQKQDPQNPNLETWAIINTQGREIISKSGPQKIAVDLFRKMGYL